MAELFKLPDHRATLVIDDGPFAGVEAEVRLSTSWASLMAIQKWLSDFGELLSARGSAEDFDLADADRQLRTAADIFAAQLVEWNVANSEGVPVPPTADGLLALDAALMGELIGLWVDSVGTVPPPLSNGSSGGAKPTTRKRARRS